MADRTMIEWGIGFLVGGLVVFFIPNVQNFIRIYVDIERDGLMTISVIAVLCGLALLVLGAKSSGKSAR